jgi:hypothetical protein
MAFILKLNSFQIPILAKTGKEASTYNIPKPFFNIEKMADTSLLKTFSF